MKKFAFFLPQFHEIKENNKWWGKGFTEWVNVRSAKPLYNGHLQPKVPIDGYYNLLEKETVIHQTNLMHKYGVDGMIYYHYYFTGKKLLEKPAENLLKWKDINQPFFFCWANHSWKRSWNGSCEMLQKQNYGTEKDWEKHFNYLLPFFKDPRYEKKENKPLFMIFDSVFEEKNKIFEYFNKKCIENGFDGIYIINSCNNVEEVDYNKKNKSNKFTNKILYRESSYSYNLNRTFMFRIINKIRKILCEKLGFTSLVQKVDGNKLIKLALKKYDFNDKSIMHGLFFEWDNTPRHKNRGYIITPISKESFNAYMDKIRDEDYVFINAWNEWCEGMMLEGTEENGYKYLEWIKEWTDNENRTNGV